MARTRSRERLVAPLGGASGRAVPWRALVIVLVVSLLVGAVALARPALWRGAPPPPLRLDHPAFSPNHDGAQEEVAILFDLDVATDVTLWVRDSEGSEVRRLIDAEAQSVGDHVATWNGRDAQGEIVPDGRYQVVIRYDGVEQTIPLVVDTVPPALELPDFESSLTVREPTLLIEGSSEPGARIHVSGQRDPIEVDASGRFRVERALSEGLNPIDVRAADAAGNETLRSRVVTRRTEPPTLLLDELVTVNGAVGESRITVRGSAPPDTQVTINGREASLTEQGRFSMDLLLVEGENLIEILARDPAGNEERVARLVTLDPTLAEGAPVETRPLDGPDGPRIAGRTLDEWLAIREVRLGLGALGALVLGLGVGMLLGTPLTCEVLVDHPVFYPNRANAQRMLIVRYRLSRAARVEIELFDEFNRPVMRLLDGQRQREGEHFRLWSGEDADGDPLPGGSYLVQVRARTLTARARNGVWVRLDPSHSAIVGVETGEPDAVPG